MRPALYRSSPQAHVFNINSPSGTRDTPAQGAQRGLRGAGGLCDGRADAGEGVGATVRGV
jgi:hypothetical protein